jgi:hypothetical protein
VAPPFSSATAGPSSRPWWLLLGADHAEWGAPFSYLDGARLAFEEDRFVSIDLDQYGKLV